MVLIKYKLPKKNQDIKEEPSIKKLRNINCVSPTRIINRMKESLESETCVLECILDRDYTSFERHVVQLNTKFDWVGPFLTH